MAGLECLCPSVYKTFLPLAIADPTVRSNSLTTSKQASSIRNRQRSRDSDGDYAHGIVDPRNAEENGFR